MTDHARPDDGLPLLAWRAAPTTSGPRPPSADGPRATRDYAAQWAAFAASEAGAPIAAWIEAEALRLDGLGVKRISTKHLIEFARAYHAVALNGNWSAPIADWLVARHPALSARIERRVRTAVAR